MSKPTDSWMPLYIAAYQVDTTHLTTEQHGAYLLLLMHAWIKGFLPDDDRALASICKMTVQKFRTIAPVIRAFLMPVGEGRLSQKRLEEERQRASKNIEQKSNAARAKHAKQKEAKYNEINEDASAAASDPQGAPQLSRSLAAGVPLPSTSEGDSLPDSDSVPAANAAPQQKRRAILSRLPSARQWWPWRNAESDPFGPNAVKRPCIQPNKGVCSEWDRDQQTYALDGFDGLPNMVFEETLVQDDNVACTEPIDWTPLLDWVRDGIPAETIYAGIKAANEAHLRKGSQFPIAGLGFYDKRIRDLAGLPPKAKAA